MNKTSANLTVFRTPARTATGLVLAVAVSLAGCSDSGSTTSPSASETSVASATSSTGSTSATRATETVTSSTTLPPEYDANDPEPVNEDPGIKPLGQPNSSEQSSSEEWGSTTGKVLPTAIRVGRHKDFDRVVIDLEAQGDSTPGWHAAYRDQPTQQASGHIIDVAGETYLNVDLINTAYPMEFGKDLAPLHWVNRSGKGVVQEVKDAGTFEARTQFVIGLSDGPRPYSVTVLKNPQRVVIDIMHHG